MAGQVTGFLVLLIQILPGFFFNLEISKVSSVCLKCGIIHWSICYNATLFWITAWIKKVKWIILLIRSSLNAPIVQRQDFSKFGCRVGPDTNYPPHLPCEELCRMESMNIILEKYAGKCSLGWKEWVKITRISNVPVRSRRMLRENVLSTPRLVSAKSVIKTVISGRSKYY